MTQIANFKSSEYFNFLDTDYSVIGYSDDVDDMDDAQLEEYLVLYPDVDIHE